MREVEDGMQHTGSGQRIAMTARVVGGLAAVMWLLPLVGELIGGDHGLVEAEQFSDD